jgi:hypothetical protein
VVVAIGEIDQVVGDGDPVRVLTDGQVVWI